MLKGLVALVTGGFRGIGRTIVLELARAGADVIVCDMRLPDDTVAEAVALGVKAKAYEMNVSDVEGIASVVTDAVEQFGKIDILVNNAGITRDNLMLRMTDDEWNSVIQTNLTGVFNVTRAVGEHMLRARSGSIINIASVSGIIGNAGQCNYSASKAGVIGFTKTCARELAPRNIRSNAVAPGFIETDMTAALPERVKDAARDHIPLKRFGKPDDVAAAVMFFASPAAAYITGQVVAVDGGMAM